MARERGSFPMRIVAASQTGTRRARVFLRLGLVELVQDDVPLATPWLHSHKAKRVCCQIDSSKPLHTLVPER